MSLQLADILECFEGMIPATMTTASAHGVPNISNISKVDYVDASHVALSRQFFRKSAANLAENPRASILVTEPSTNRNFKLAATLVRIDTEGPVFEQLRIRVDAIAALTGMEGVFKLEGAYVFRVDQVDEVVGALVDRGV